MGVWACEYARVCMYTHAQTYQNMDVTGQLWGVRVLSSHLKLVSMWDPTDVMKPGGKDLCLLSHHVSSKMKIIIQFL